MAIAVADGLNLAAAFGYVLLGTYTLLLDTEKRLTKALGGMMLSLAALYAYQGLVEDRLIYFEVIKNCTYLLISLAVIRVARAFLPGWQESSKRYRGTAMVYVAVSALAGMAYVATTPDNLVSFSAQSRIGSRLLFAVIQSLQFGSLAYLNVMSFASAINRFGDAAQKASAGLVKAGFTGISAGAASAWLFPYGGTWNAYAYNTALTSTLILGFTLIWGYHGLRSKIPGILGSFGLQMGFIAIAIVVVAITDSLQYAYPVMRVVALALFVVAATQNLIEGFDEKMRVGISRTTVAAIFVTAIFVASEATQQAFGSSWVGIAAAGAIVFFLAPIQRFADQLANSAVPEQETPTTTYTEALRMALANGAIEPKEERLLALLADRLGLTATQTLEIRDDLTKSS